MRFRSVSTVVLSVVAAVLLASCGSGGGKGGGTAPSGEMIKLQGAGASFPAPLYTKWFRDFNEKNKSVVVDYQSVGSGSGVKSVIDKTVDFGASDAAMTKEEVAKVDAGVVLLPMTAGSIVLAYNLEGVKDLKLSRDAYLGIFTGKITKWSDPAIAKANPDVKLPDSTINVVVRADSSGTTYVFTKHLSAISESFAKEIGTNKMPNWPVGTKSKGNEGVTASLKTTPGSIGYVEYGYANLQKMPMASLENKAGKFVAPTSDSAQASLSTAMMPDDLIVWVSDPEGNGSYPIVTFTWIMCYKKYADTKKAEALRNVLEYALTEGQKDSDRLGYVALPASVVEKVKVAVKTIK